MRDAGFNSEKNAISPALELAQAYFTRALIRRTYTQPRAP
jgi:hypothetical protein